MGMMDKVFEICVIFKGVDMLTAPMNKMAGKMGLLDKQTEQLQKKLNGFKNMAFVGGGITLAGSMMVGAMEKGVDEASKFLTKMTIIKDTTGATADQMERIQKVIRSSSGQTIFGVQETASFGKLLATSGMGGDQIEKLLPIFTQYAEVQKLGKGGSPEEAITQAIGAAHMTGNYDPEQLSAFLDKYNKATFMQPGSSSEFADTFKYLSSRTQGIGMSTEDQLTMAALSNRVGLAGSIGGTEGADLILRSIPGLMGGRGKKDSKQTAALKELGLSNTIFDEGGNFKGLTNFIEQLQKASVGKNPEQLTKLYHDAFGQQGMGLANILSSSRGQEQLKALSQQMGGMKSIGQMQEDTNQTPEGQMLQLKTNIENLKLGVFLKLAEYLNPVFKWLNLIVGKTQEFLDKHPMLNSIIAGFGIFATALALIVGPLLLIVGAIGYIGTAGIVGTGFAMLGAALSVIAPFILPVVAGVALLALAGNLIYENWGKIEPMLIQLWGSIKQAVLPLIVWMRDCIINAWMAVKGWLDTNMPQIMQVIREAWIVISPIISTIMDTIKTLIIVGWDIITGVFRLAWDLICNIVRLGWDIISGVITIGLDILTGNWGKAWNDIWVLLGNFWSDIKSLFGGLVTDFFNLGADIVKGIANGIWSVITLPFNALMAVYQKMKSVKLSGSFIEDSEHSTAGYASGTNFAPGGMAWVGENGPELVNLPRGSKVTPNGESGGGVSIGEINVYAAEGQSASEIAREVLQEVGRKMRDQSLCRSSQIQPGW